LNHLNLSIKPLLANYYELIWKTKTADWFSGYTRECWTLYERKTNTK